MTDIYFKCPCGKSMAVDIHAIGRNVGCVDCARIITVPDADLDFTCGNCRTVHMAPAAIAGSCITCTQCAQRVFVGNERFELLQPELRRRYPAFRVNRPAATRPFDWRKAVSYSFPALSAVAILILMVEVFDFSTETPTPAPAPLPASDQVIVDFPPSSLPDDPGKDAISVVALALASLNKAPSLPDNIEVFTETPAVLLPAELHPKGDAGAEHEPGNIIQMAAHDPPPDEQTRATMPDAGTPAPEHPARQFVERARAITAAYQENRLTCTPEIRQQAGDLRKEFMDYTLAHSGPDLDLYNWWIAGKHVLLLASQLEFDEFEDADEAFRNNIRIIADARTDDPAMNRRMIFDCILMHQQEWRNRAPVEACAAWLDRAHAMMHATEDEYIWWQWAASAAHHEIALIFAWNARQHLSEERLQAFRARRISIVMDYLNNADVPLQTRTFSLWGWASYLASADQPSAAIRLLEDWHRKYGEQITDPAFYALRMFLAFNHEGDLHIARQMLRRVSAMVRQGLVPEDEWQWRNMTERYFNNLLIPAMEVKRLYRRQMKAGHKPSGSKT